MYSTSALILESCDFTKDGNLKKEAFDAFARAELVVRNGVVIKTGAPLVSQAMKMDHPLAKRVRKAKAAPAEPSESPEP